MADIETLLAKIMSATLGEEVRGSIHDSIDLINKEVYRNLMSDDVKQALLDCFAHVAWKGTDGDDYYDALEDALYPPMDLVSISAVYTQSGSVYPTDSLDSLKSDLVVTAHWNDQTTSTLSDNAYVLSGTLTEGTSTITVTYARKTTTFNVTVAPLHIYMLQSPFNCTGSNGIDTEVLMSSGNTYTFYGDVTIDNDTSITSVSHVWGNNAGHEGYSAMQVQYTSSVFNMWGVGISWANRLTWSAGSAKRFRFVAIIDVDTVTTTLKVRDMSGSTVREYQNTYTTGGVTTENTVHIGSPTGSANGFHGTMTEFYIDDSALSAEEITAYLSGGE